MTQAPNSKACPERGEAESNGLQHPEKLETSIIQTGSMLVLGGLSD